MSDRVEHFMERLLVEFPDWSNEQAYTAAEAIVRNAEQIAFQIDIERDLAALPLTTERRVA